jgi:hypothetical protein
MDNLHSKIKAISFEVSAMVPFLAIAHANDLQSTAYHP